MNDKFTIRDFLVYFLTGLFLFLTLLFYYKIKMLNLFSLNISDLKDNSSLIIFLLLPGLYLLGIFIHSIDNILFKFGLNIYLIVEKQSIFFKKNYLKWIFDIIIYFLNGYRITGRLIAQGNDHNQFWKDCNKLTNNSKYEKADYWNLMHCLSEGLLLITLGWTVFFFINFSFKELFIGLFVTVVFWNRSKEMADNFIKTVRNSIEYFP